MTGPGAVGGARRGHHKSPRGRRSGILLFVALAVAATLFTGPRSAQAVYSNAFCLFAGIPAGPAISAPLLSPLAGVPADEKADLVLLNGIFYTADPARPRVEALAVCGERIVATGSSREMRAWIGPQMRAIDLHRRFAMPGFNDAHIHLASGGLAKLEVNFEGAKSLAEFQERIRRRLAESKPGEWILGRGWDHTLWPEKRFPTRADLDAVSRLHRGKLADFVVLSADVTHLPPREILKTEVRMTIVGGRLVYEKR